MISNNSSNLDVVALAQQLGPRGTLQPEEHDVFAEDIDAKDAPVLTQIEDDVGSGKRLEFR